MMHEIPINDYEKQQIAIKNRLAVVAKKSGSEILKSQAETEKRNKDETIQQNCHMARMLMDEGIEMYKSGRMDFKEMVDDLHKSMMAIAKEK